MGIQQVMQGLRHGFLSELAHMIEREDTGSIYLRGPETGLLEEIRKEGLVLF